MFRTSVTEIKQNCADLLNRVAYGKERIVLHRRGKDIVALVPIEDFELLEQQREKERVLEAQREKRRR